MGCARGLRREGMCQRLCGWRETIQGTDDSDRRAVDHVGVDHGGLQTGMAEKRLHLADVVSGVKQVGCEAVAEGVAGDAAV